MGCQSEWWKLERYTWSMVGAEEDEEGPKTERGFLFFLFATTKELTKMQETQQVDSST